MATIAGTRAAAVRTIPFAALAAALNLAIALPLAYILNIWQDEAYTLHSAAGGAGYAFHQALAFEQNAPLYFVAMAVWHNASASPFFFRLFSVLCALGTILLIPGLAKRYANGVDARLVTLAVALNPFLMWAALEIRVYALVVLLSAALLLLFYDAFLAETPSRRAWIAYAVLCIVALYTQYYLAFLIAAQGAYLLLTPARTAFLRFLAAAGAGVLAFAPLLAVVPGQMENFRGIFSAPSSPFAAAGTLLSILARYLVPAAALPHPLVLYAAIVLAALAFAAINRRSLKRAPDLTVAILTFFTLAIFAAAIYAAREHVLNRHAALLFVPGELSVFALIAAFRTPLRTRTAAAWTIAVLLLSIADLVSTYAHGAKPGDWIRLTAFLRQHESPGQPIAVFQAENALPFAYYYRGPNRIVAIPQAVDFRRYDVSEFVVRDERQLQQRFPSATHGVWLIVAGECASANVQFGCPIVERYVTRRYRVTIDRQFYGARLRLLLPLARGSSHGR